jgi:hypothetical protein
MRHQLIAAITFLTLAGCGASQQQVTAALQERYSGQRVDVLVAQFGPPTSTFTMQDGSASYEWNIANRTDVIASQYSAMSATGYCKIRVIATADGFIKQVGTTDAGDGLNKSLCASKLRQLGIPVTSTGA